MHRKIRVTLLLALVIAVVARPVRAEVTAEQVRDAINEGAAYLKGQQDKVNGNWTEHIGQPCGVSALCTLALLNSGVEVKDPSIQRALSYLRAMGNPEMTYSTALQTMVLCAAEPEKDRLLISRNVKWLESSQIKTGPKKGAWAYSDRQGNGDNSNAQFALLALHEADRVGVPASEQTWRIALAYWRKVQQADGSWGYFEGMPASGSMTCAGVSSMVICLDKLPEYRGAASVDGDSVRCCGQQRESEEVERGLQWLGQHFSVTTNPVAVSSRDGTLARMHLFYYLYGMERVGRMTGRRFLVGKQRHDWYREGAEMFVDQQDRLSRYWKGVGHAENNPQIATALALLFLSKGRRPVVMAKLQYGDGVDWDLHPQGVQHLTEHVEKAWRRDLTWQTIDFRLATVDDLMEAPVLFLSGRNALNLTPAQKDNLREYINRGGFIFAEACDGNGCDGTAFRAEFPKLMVELFGSEPRALPPDHAVWFAEQKVDAKHLPADLWLYGIDACCRTSVIYCPQSLSCYWELARGDREPKHSDRVRNEIDACTKIGMNVLAYATNREVKEKLDRPALVVSDRPDLRQSRDMLFVPKLSHSGGSDDAPNALPNLLSIASQQIKIRLSPETRPPIAPSDPQLLDNPIVFMHGRRAFQFTPAERIALATYLQRGGFLFADSICASPQFAESFRNEIKALFPGRELARLPPDHPLFTQEYRGFDLSSVTLRDPQVRATGDPLKANLTRIAPLLEGLEIDGRLAVIFSPYDISCALENHESLECKGYIKTDAARIGINVILYALQQ
jgi:hypothetical protein